MGHLSNLSNRSAPCQVICKILKGLKLVEATLTLLATSKLTQATDENGPVIGPLTGPSSENTSHDALYGHSHHSHFHKHTLNTHGRLWTSIFDSEPFSMTLNVSEVFRNTPNAPGCSHPTPLTFGHVSCIFPTRIHSSSNVLDTCPQDSTQALKERGVLQYFVIYYDKGQFDLDIFSSYYIIIFWSHSSSHIVPHFLLM
jgi:hypothetical protein